MTPVLPTYQDTLTEHAALETHPPIYKPSIHRFELAMWKKELQTPFKLASDRSWRLVIVELNSVQLNIYDVRSNDIALKKLFESAGQTHTTNIDSNRLARTLLPKDHLTSISAETIKPYLGKQRKSYTLQGACFGSAIDYHKRRFTLRLRCEINQFLLSFVSVQRFAKFFTDLQTCAELALPIDERGGSRKYKTVPTEINRFRLENFNDFYNSLSEESEEMNLSTFRRNTIDGTYDLSMPDIQPYDSCHSLPTVLDSADDKICPWREEFIDEQLIFSLTCIKKLESTKCWRGEVVVTGDFNQKKLCRFREGSVDYDEGKLIIAIEKFEEFRKIVRKKQEVNSKRFMMKGCLLVEVSG